MSLRPRGQDRPPFPRDVDAATGIAGLVLHRRLGPSPMARTKWLIWRFPSR